MDMRRHVATWINDALLVRLGGSYEGVISGVVEQLVRNRYTAQRERHPVIEFNDGHRLVPNTGMRRALIEMFGPHTEHWCGRKIVVTRRQVERTNSDTGKVTAAWEKVVSCPDIHARIAEDTRPANFEPVNANDIQWTTHPHDSRKVQ
jgi:hypothetical protein